MTQLNLSFDIITIAKNSSEVISKTLVSVNAQTYDQINHIIVDGNSTDETVDIITNFNKNKETTIISQSASGISNAFNIGLSSSNGNLVIFLNAGDYLFNIYVIEKIVNSYLKESWLWAFGETISLSKKGSIKRHRKQYHRWDQKYFLKSSVMCHQSTVYSSNLLRKVGFYDENLDLGMDYDFNVRSSFIAYPFLLNFPVSYYDVSGISSVKVFKRYYLHTKLRKVYFKTTFANNIFLDISGFFGALKRFLLLPFKLFL